MSDSNNRSGGPPPDDFSKTTPNINLPNDSDGQGDWNKTNYNMPKQPPSDDWGKTVANIKPIDTSGQDFDKTYFPGSNTPSTPEWGVTNARVNVEGADFGTNPEDFGGSKQAYDKTTPYFKLPEAERSKYQNLPPTPTEQAAQDAKAEQEKGGLPGWFWVLAGLVVMFFFAIIVLVLAWWIGSGNNSYDVTIRGVPTGSTIRVGGSQWGVSQNGGDTLVSNLKAGEKKKIEIINPNWVCQPLEVISQNGKIDPPSPLIAQCKQITPGPTPTPVQNPQCAEFKPGEVDKSVTCYNMALDALNADTFTAEDLVSALSILIINFDSNKYDVPAARMPNLQRGADFIKKLQQRDPTVVLEIGGHTDNKGTDAKNQPLSEHRAAAVKDVLVNKFGVNGTGLQTRGYGALNPKYDNSTDTGRFMNRRIEYKIVKK